MVSSAQPKSAELNRNFTMDELKATIKALKNKKAVGPDRIANEFIKLANEDILKLILSYFNLNLNKGLTCSEWCLDLIALIHKDGAKDNPNNYRGICIMNALLKILCSLLNSRLTSFCDNKNLINKEQIGFRKNNRTADHILTLKATVNKYVNDKQNKKLYACFVDFQKAFDTVNHNILIKKLNHYGIRGTANKWFESYLNKRKQCVSIAGQQSEYRYINHGVPQGSVLGPLLFLVYINDLHLSIRHSTVRHFADDTNLLYATDKSKPRNRNIVRNLNKDLKSLNHWLLANKNIT